MNAMEHPALSAPPAAGARGTHTSATTDEQYIPHFRSLTMPGLAKGPIVPAWLRRRFRHKDTPAARS